MRTHNIFTAECSNAGWVSNPNFCLLVRTGFFCLLSHVLLPHLKERCRNVCLCISCVYRNIGRYIDTRIFKSLILQQSQSSALAPKISCVLICTLFDLIQNFTFLYISYNIFFVKYQSDLKKARMLYCLSI